MKRNKRKSAINSIDVGLLVMIIALLIIAVVTSGCASNGTAATQAAEYYERKAQECEVVTVKRTGSRIRRTMEQDYDQLHSARCARGYK